MSTHVEGKKRKPVSTEAAWTWFRDVLGSPKYIVAPMVNQSDLPFRRMCRKYGADLAFTPMLHSKLFAEENNDRYRSQKFNTTPDEGPLIAQFCGNDPDLVVKAAKMVQDQVHGIDLNLGCPQGIARKGHYGAFLMKYPDTVRSVVEAMHNELNVPVSCKIRLLEAGVDATISFCKMLQEAGCSMITVHGRTVKSKKMKTGTSDLQALRRIKEAVDIPVIANGGVTCYADIDHILRVTGCDGVMVSELLLCNPTLFAGPQEVVMSPTDMAREYLEFVRTSNVELFPLKPHMFRLLHGILNLEVNHDLRAKLSKARSFEEFEFIASVPDLLDERESKASEEDRKKWHDPMQQWYFRHAYKDPATQEIIWNDTPVPKNQQKSKVEAQTTKRKDPPELLASSTHTATEKKQKVAQQSRQTEQL